MPIKNWSTTAGSNTSSPPNGAPEGMLPGAVNDVIRQNMADVRAWYEDAQWLDWGHTPTRVSDTQFSVATDQTAVYAVNRRVRVIGATTGYGKITASSYSNPTTTITVSWDSGVTPTSPTSAAVGLLTPTSMSVPATVARTDLINTFTAAQVIQTNAPALGWLEADAAADNKLWRFAASGESFIGLALNDAENSNSNWLTVERTGITIDSVTLAATTINLSGTAQVSGNTIYHTGNADLGTTKTKTAQETVNNSTTLQNDDHLTGFSVTSGQTYVIEGHLNLNTGPVGSGFRMAFSGAPSSGQLFVFGYASVIAQDIRLVGTPGGGVVWTHSGSPNGTQLVVRGFFVADATTSLTMQWAQGTAVSGSSILNTGSWITIRKIS